MNIFLFCLDNTVGGVDKLYFVPAPDWQPNGFIDPPENLCDTYWWLHTWRIAPLQQPCDRPTVNALETRPATSSLAGHGAGTTSCLLYLLYGHSNIGGFLVCLVKEGVANHCWDFSLGSGFDKWPKMLFLGLEVFFKNYVTMWLQWSVPLQYERSCKTIFSDLASPNNGRKI